MDCNIKEAFVSGDKLKDISKSEITAGLKNEGVIVVNSLLYIFDLKWMCERIEVVDGVSDYSKLKDTPAYELFRNAANRISDIDTITKGAVSLAKGEKKPFDVVFDEDLIDREGKFFLKHAAPSVVRKGFPNLKKEQDSLIKLLDKDPIYKNIEDVFSIIERLVIKTEWDSTKLSEMIDKINSGKTIRDIFYV